MSYPYKITIFSPGTLYGGITIEDLKTDTYQSCTRNKLIAGAFYLTNNIEKYGSGYIRIREEMKVYPELTFSIEETSGGILVPSKLLNAGSSNCATKEKVVFKGAPKTGGYYVAD